MNALARPESALRARADDLYRAQELEHMRRTNRVFGWLMLFQWIAAAFLAIFVSPLAWAGRTASVHVHVLAAVFLGGALSGFPAYLAFRRSGWTGTKHILACSQVLWSALLIHLTGGRIETHFHVFGSLAFIAFYRDYKALIAPTLLVALDHLVRGLFWPESVYGQSEVQALRFLEHAGWVLFEDVVLVLSCLRAHEEMRMLATNRAELEALGALEREKSVELATALRELAGSQDALVRTEKLAAIGRLAASVGHELRNPLSAIRNAVAFVRRKLAPYDEPRAAQLLGVADRELDACGKIIADLLDYARERPLALSACPLQPLVEETIDVLPNPKGIRVRNEIAVDMAAPTVDRDLFRQVLANLIQNALEATPADGGDVVVSAEGGGGRPFEITIADSGTGMGPEVVSQIFEPLFTTKTKGTGLGLAIVANMIRRHGGTIRVESDIGRGSRFRIEVPEMRALATA